MHKPKFVKRILIAVVFGFISLQAGEMPPQNAKKLSHIIQLLESKGFAPITEVSLDRGVWEVEAYKNGQKRELHVDPITGRILSNRHDH
jgi:hypothetical protein